MTLSSSSRKHRDSRSSSKASRRWTSNTDANSNRSSRRRSRSPPSSSRRTARHERSMSPDRTDKSPATTGTGAADGGDPEDIKKLSMKERLAMWKKRKEQEKGMGSPTATMTATSTAGSPDEPPSRPMSRASSIADDSNDSSRFVTAPSSIPSDHDHLSPPFASVSSEEQPAAISNSGRRTEDAGAKPGIGGGLGSRAKPLGKFGKIKLAGSALGGGRAKRPMLSRPSPLAASVFGADTDDSETERGLNGNGVARKLTPLPPIASPDSQTTGRDAQVHNQSAEFVSDKVSTSMDVDYEVDPLEVFMQTMVYQAKDSAGNSADNDDKEGNISYLGSANTAAPMAKQALVEDDTDDLDDVDADVEDVLALAAKRLKKKEIAAVDHSKMNYESFKRNFYIEPAELRNMDPEEVERMRADLGGIKIRGVDAPKPATSWSHFGLPSACADVIKHQGFEKPTPVQAQTVPAILSGRDVIGVAKTGSGKTLAFILPMLRHIKAQRPLAQGEGPIGLVMTPTRELAVQIHRECKPFLRPLGLRAVCAYGGSAIKDQIGELKRGCEIVVCTPGRLIDLLCANSGRVTNLHRVTYLVLDEADRMFDMGFEPQVSKIVQIVRPSRQTVMFSATFPRQMEALARKTLRRPLEIVVGGRALIPPEVTMHATVLEAKDKFLRLLGILGESFNANGETLALIFVDRQEAADTLLRDLMHRGYVCNSLHGGKDQTDRDQAIIDFKNRVYSVLIATSVAARGLDVRGLNVVINYDCPNHMEDLVHRVGRTGRAGNTGDAYTFITPDQERYANEVVKAMKLSELTPPDDVQELADLFLEKVRQGKEHHSSSKSGFGGKGLEKLDKDRDMVKKIQKMTYGSADGDALDDEDEDDDGNQVELDSDGEIVVSSKRKAKAKGDQLKDGEVVRRLNKSNDSRRPSASGSATNTNGSINTADRKQAAVTGPQNAPSMAIPGGGASATASVDAGGISEATRAAVLAAQAAARRLNIGVEPGSRSGDVAQAPAPLSVVDQINQQLGISPTASAHKRDGIASGGPSRGRGVANATSRGAVSGRESSGGTSAAAAMAGDLAAASASSAAAAAAAAIPVGAFGCELDINDYHQTARWKATNRDTLTQIIEQTGVAITTRGIFVPAGKSAPEGERKLYLSIEGDSERAVERAKTEIKRILTEATVHIMEQDARASGGGSGRYSVV